MRLGLSARLYKITELKTSSLENEISNGMSGCSFSVHEEEESGITLVGKQESRARKRSD